MLDERVKAESSLQLFGSLVLEKYMYSVVNAIIWSINLKFWWAPSKLTVRVSTGWQSPARVSTQSGAWCTAACPAASSSATTTPWPPSPPPQCQSSPPTPDQSGCWPLTPVTPSWPAEVTTPGCVCGALPAHRADTGGNSASEDMRTMSECWPGSTIPSHLRLHLASNISLWVCKSILIAQICLLAANFILKALIVYHYAFLHSDLVIILSDCKPNFSFLNIHEIISLSGTHRILLSKQINNNSTAIII